MPTLRDLRLRHKRFVYKGFRYKLEGKDLHISFYFFVSPNIHFHPKLVIKDISARDIQRVGESTLKNFVFHLGLMEIPSYWKATCSPEVIIEKGYLNKDQIAWWKDLILKGLGEFFYQNKIDFTIKDFLTITSLAKPSYPCLGLATEFKQGTLIPIGGGKDAIVTLELLKKVKHKIRPFILNPKKEQREILKIAGEKDPIIVDRKIDAKLFELNRKGYLNGHTPFSAYLAFLSVLAAALSDYRYIAVSNERSSNEGNTTYKGKVINHQYSKSFEFEKKFRAYATRYLIKEVEYFSFLRPLYELQIAKIFAKYPKYFSAFLSCNEAHKTQSGTKKPLGKWCGACPKCLFVFMTLYPFVEEKKLIAIFKKNLFEDKSLIPLLEELIGKRGVKPFECVGTKQESIAALYVSMIKKEKHLPVLLQYAKTHVFKNSNISSHKILRSWNPHHFIPAQFARLLKKTY